MTDVVQRAVAAMQAGEMVLVVDDAERENEGDLFIAAQHTTAEAVAFMLQHTSGFICVAASGEICDELGLHQMVAVNNEAHNTAFTVTVDLRARTTTGISARDRASTIGALGSPTSKAEDFLRPGHVHVLRARDGGLAERSGHTEAAVDLARLAGLRPAVAICEVVTADKLEMARKDELQQLAQDHNIVFVDVSEIQQAVSAGAVALSRA